jgi:hypothetical protein
MRKSGGDNMNMIMTPTRVLEAREALVGQLTQRVCDAINNHLISGCDNETFWTLTIRKESLFLEGYRPSLWSAKLANGSTIAENVKFNVRRFGVDSGYNIKLSEDVVSGALHATSSLKSVDVNALSILEFTELILGCKLHPVQKVLMKALYAGTTFNETVLLDDDDVNHLRHNPVHELYGLSEETLRGITHLSEGQCDKYCAVRIGRRGGQTFLASLCAVYELYRNTNPDTIVAYLHMSDGRTLAKMVQKMIDSFPERNLRLSNQLQTQWIYQKNDVLFVAQKVCDQTPEMLAEFKVKTLIRESANKHIPLRQDPDRVIEFLDSSIFAPVHLDFPAWIMNPELSKDDLLKNREDDPDRFDKQFGAR